MKSDKILKILLIVSVSINIGLATYVSNTVYNFMQIDTGAGPTLGGGPMKILIIIGFASYSYEGSYGYSLNLYRNGTLVFPTSDSSKMMVVIPSYPKTYEIKAIPKTNFMFDHWVINEVVNNSYAGLGDNLQRLFSYDPNYEPFNQTVTTINPYIFTTNFDMSYTYHIYAFIAVGKSVYS